LSSASLPGDPPFEITQLLVAWRKGSEDALEPGFPFWTPTTRNAE
jgi:hypothetical protein